MSRTGRRNSETAAAADAQVRAIEIAGGMFDPRPDPDPSNYAYSHGTDQVRCPAWALRRLFGIPFGWGEHAAG